MAKTNTIQMSDEHGIIIDVKKTKTRSQLKEEESRIVKAAAAGIEIAKAMADVGQVIVNSAKIEVDMVKAIHGKKELTGFLTGDDPDDATPKLPPAPKLTQVEQSLKAQGYSDTEIAKLKEGYGKDGVKTLTNGYHGEG